MSGVPEEEFALQDVLQGETLRKARRAFRKTPEVLQSPILFRDDLPDHIIGFTPEHTGSAQFPNESGYAIALNGRVRMDPADIVRVLAEEAMHVARKFKKRPFDYTLPYEQRLHEITAKRGARYLTGRDDLYDMPVIRPRIAPTQPTGNITPLLRRRPPGEIRRGDGEAHRGP